MPNNDYANTPKGWTARLIARTKHRANKNNIPYDIDIHWFRDKLSSMHCEITGIHFPLDFYTRGERTPFSPSIDRIIPELGYVKTNCQVVCFIYNYAKANFTDEDVLRMAQALINKKVDD